MIEYLWNMFDSAGLMPHGVCFLWREDLVHLHLFSDVAVTLAYFSLPAFLIILVKRKPELRHSGVIPLFALFILLCGLTHASNIWVLFVPDYLAQGVIKGVTAIVSIVTAIMVWPLLPKLVAMPSTQELIDANERLRREIDSRKAAEAYSDKLTEAMMELDDAVAVFDTEDRLVVANKSWGIVNKELVQGDGVGMTFEEIVRMNVEAGHVPAAIGDEEEWIRKRVAVHRNPGAPMDVEFASGKCIRMQEQRLPSGGIILIGADVTNAKRWEEANRRSQRMESVGQLTGGIAHDFNNLLAIISGNLELMRRHGIGNEKLATRIESAKAATDRGADLARKLLNFSRQDGFTLEATNINEMIVNIEELLKTSLTTGIDVEIHGDENLWLTKVDTGDLGDAVVNLAINARDAMPDGGRLIIETANKSIADDAMAGDIPPGDYIVLSVTDTGTGIAKEDIERIFEPFFSTKQESHGTGLGLSMVYGFVKRSHGEIRVYSEVGHGTTMRIYLPRALGARAQHKAETETEHAASKPQTTGTILIVDDEEMLLDVIRMAMEDAGYDVVTAPNGTKAVEILESDREIDLMLSDVIMPGGIDGYGLAGKAAELRPEMAVILASGFTGKLSENRLPENTVDRVVAKPYDITDMAKAVRECIDRRKTARGVAAADIGDRESGNRHNTVAPLATALID